MENELSEGVVQRYKSESSNINDSFGSKKMGSNALNEMTETEGSSRKTSVDLGGLDMEAFMVECFAIIDGRFD